MLPLNDTFKHMRLKFMALAVMLIVNQWRAGCIICVFLDLLCEQGAMTAAVNAFPLQSETCDSRVQEVLQV